MTWIMSGVNAHFDHMHDAFARGWAGAACLHTSPPCTSNYQGAAKQPAGFCFLVCSRLGNQTRLALAACLGLSLHGRYGEPQLGPAQTTVLASFSLVA